MDLDKALVEALLREGRKAVFQAASRGINPEILQGGGKQALEFVLDYVKNYEDCPDENLVYARTGVTLADPIDPVEPRQSGVWIDAVLDRQLQKLLYTGCEEAVTHLGAAQPKKAQESLEQALREVSKQRLGEAKVVSLLEYGDEVWDLYQRMKAGEHGIRTPWPLLDEATRGFWPQDLIVAVARTSIGKCVYFHSFLQDPDTGLLHTIEELVDTPLVSNNTTSWSKEDGIHVRGITAKQHPEDKECLKVGLGTGRDLTVSTEHPLLTPGGWRQTQELRVGDTVALPARMPFPRYPVKLQDHEIDVLALMLADGACTDSETTFSKADLDIVQLARVAAGAFGAQLTGGPQAWCFTTVGSRHHGSNPVRNFLQDQGVMGTLSKHKVVPESVFRLPREGLARFLRVFLSCDGYANAGVGVTLASEKLVRALQHLLLRFGIQSSVHYKLAKCQTGEFDSWRLRIYTSHLPLFVREIGLLGYKARKLLEHLSWDRQVAHSNVGAPRVSRAMMRDIKSRAGATGCHNPNGDVLRQIAQRLGRKVFTPKDLFKCHGEDQFSVSLHALEVFCEEFGCSEDFRWLWDSEIFWDTIQSVTPVGLQPVRDLTVAPTQCFVADDVLVHNSWLCVIIAAHAWSQGKKVLFVTTEMSQRSVANRFYAVHLKLPYKDLMGGKLGIFHEQKLQEQIAAIKGLPGLQIIGGTFDFSVSAFSSAVEEAKPDLVVLDGAYLLKTEGKDRTAKAANAFDELKRVAITHNVPLVATMQFNREVKADKKGSASLEKIALTDVGAWNASLVIALTQTDAMKKKRTMILQQLKVREGEGRDLELNWDLDMMNFKEIGIVGGGGGGDADEFGAGNVPGGPVVTPLDSLPF